MNKILKFLDLTTFAFNVNPDSLLKNLSKIVKYPSIQEINSRKNIFPLRLRKYFPVKPINLTAKFFSLYCTREFLTAQIVKDCPVPVYFPMRTRMVVVSEEQFKKLGLPIF